MNLNERKREEHRGRILERIGSVLVCMSVLLASAFPPQPACAVFVADDAAIAAVVSAFLSSCGMTFSASGMDSNGVKDQVGHLIDDYIADQNYQFQSRLEWLAGADDRTVEAVAEWKNGVLIIKSNVANKLSAFATWVKDECGITAGQTATLYDASTYCLTLSDGTTLNLSYPDSVNGCDAEISSLGYVFSDYAPRVYTFSSGAYLECTILTRKDGSKVNCYGFYDSTGNNVFGTSGETDQISTIVRLSTGQLYFAQRYHNYTTYYLHQDISSYLTASENANRFAVESSVISIPETIPDDKDVVITTGAAEGVSYDEMLDQILAAIAAGQLATTKEIADAGTATGTGEAVVPVEETMPVIGELGLPALGEALTTRFPFSIPWDVTRAIRLLAAPPKTPRFEVDFIAPIAYRFGGNLGNTKIVLDFQEYEIIGQVSRWASTIGFCLLLASGTKKLIWTA